MAKAKRKGRGPASSRTSQRRGPAGEDRDFAIALGTLIRVAREDSNMSRAQLAKAVGVSAATISRIESGQTLPNASLLAKLTNVLDLEPNSVNEVVNQSTDWKSFIAPAAFFMGAALGGPLGLAVRTGLIGAAVAAAYDALKKKDDD
jgi:transcriptional regulator with XRE-family HTH domain